MKIRTLRFVREGRYHCDTVDLSNDRPRVVSGYEYPLPLRKGQVDDLPRMSANERMTCIVRNHRSQTTVNGICLDCLVQARKHA